jgi:hypothetical protein
VVGLVLAVVAAWGAARWRGSLQLEEWLGLGVILWATVAAVMNLGNFLAAKEMLAAWLVSWVLFVIARRTDDGVRRTMVALVSVAAAVVAMVALLECLGAGRLRMGGLFVNPNVAAALMVPAIPAAWPLLKGDHRRWTVPLAVILVGGVIATGSRAGLLALVAVAWLALPPGKVRTLGGLAAAAAAAAVLAWRFAVRPDSLAWHRLEIWRALWGLVAANPLIGVGPGWLEEVTGTVRIAHSEPIARYRHVIGSAESTPLGLLVRTGMVGLGLAVWGVIVWLRRGLEGGLLRERSTRTLLVAIVVLGAFHDVLDQSVVLWWWAVLLAVVEPASEQVGAPRPALRPALASRVVAALAVAGLVLWGVVQPAYARRLWWSQPSTAELSERVLRAEPWFGEVARWRTRELLRRSLWSWETAAEAMFWSRRATGLERSSAAVWSEYGLVNARVAEQRGAWKDAIEAAREGFRRATELEPHLPWHWLRWGQFERTRGRLEEARRLATRSVTEEPLFVRGWLFLARVELDLGRVEQARTALDRAVRGHDRARWRLLSEYERDLTLLPAWQLAELELALR